VHNNTLRFLYRVQSWHSDITDITEKLTDLFI